MSDPDRMLDVLALTLRRVGEQAVMTVAPYPEMTRFEAMKVTLIEVRDQFLGIMSSGEVAPIASFDAGDFDIEVREAK